MKLRKVIHVASFPLILNDNACPKANKNPYGTPVKNISLNNSKALNLFLKFGNIKVSNLLQFPKKG